jgi:hypothetical protein
MQFWLETELDWHITTTASGFASFPSRGVLI